MAMGYPSGVGGAYTPEMYEEDMRRLAENAPYLLSPEQLAQYTAPPVTAPTTPTGLKEGDTWTNQDGEWTVINGKWELTSPIMPGTEPPTTEPPTEFPAGLFVCPYCQAHFSSMADLAAHLTAAHSGGESQNPWLNYLGEGRGGLAGAAMGTAGMNPWLPGSSQFMEEEYGRWPGFGTELGLFGRQYLSPHEQYQAGLQPGLETLYDVGGRMSTAGGFSQYAPGGMFSQWAPQYAQDPFAMYGLARGMMGNVFGMTPEQRAGADIGYGTAPGDISDLMAMGLRTQLGKGTAGWLAGKMPTEQQSWLSQYPQQQGPSFLDYIREKYNLGQYF